MEPAERRMNVPRVDKCRPRGPSPRSRDLAAQPKVSAQALAWPRRPKLPPDGCETCSKPRARGRPRIQRIKLWPEALDTAVKVPEKDVLLNQLQVSQKVEERLEQAEAGDGVTLSDQGNSKIAIDECFGVEPDPKVCAAVYDVADVLDGMYFVHTSEGTGCSIGAERTKNGVSASLPGGVYYRIRSKCPRSPSSQA